MGFYRGPSIVRDGLVLYLDAANPKSLDTRNLLYNTDSLTGWSKAPYDGVMSITPNFTLAPDGTFTASKFQFTQTIAYRCVMRNALLKLGETHTFSVYAKAVSGTATFSLDIGDQGNKSFTVNDTEWVRCSITHTRTSQYSETTNFADITANLGTEVYLWGAQLNYGGLIDYVPVGNTSIPFRNLTGSENNGTLTNGPTFDSANGGSIVFDGVNDFCLLSQTMTLSTWTLHVDLFYQYNNKTFEFFFGNNIGDSSGKILLSYNGLVSFRNSTYYNFNVQSAELTNKNNILSFTSDGVSVFLYVNGVYRSTVTPNSTQLPIQSIGRAWGDLVWNSRFNLNNIKVYNRALSAEEILQNYNATKSRFGL